MFNKIAHAADHTSNSIKLQLLKSIFMIALLIGIAAKQHEFLYHAVASHPELNLLIIGVFVFGLVMAMRSIISLYHDDRALRWMKVTYSDFEPTDHMVSDTGMKRLMRVSTPAKLFRFPRIIGQVFELAEEELMQNRSLHVSLAQRNAMMGMVHDSINREKSLVHYITGVMILLGLIGTFIGLMEMVASVGGIVGGLAKAGSGSDEAIKGVIKDLVAPLTGMATGFSASLFGLLGSLVLGLVARFGQTATLVLKHDLEHWLTRISSLETPTQLSTSSQSGGASNSVAALAASLIGSFRTVQGILMRSADTMRKLADRQDTQTDAMNRLIASVDALSVRQEQALWQLRRVDAIGDKVEAMQSEMILNEKAMVNRLTIEFAKLSDQFDRADSAHAVRYVDVQAQSRTTENMARALEIQMVRGFEDLALKSSSVLTEQAELRRLMHDNQDVVAETLRTQNKPIDMTLLSDRIGAGVDERLAAGFGAIASSLDQSLDRLANGLMHFGDAQRVAIDKLDGITAHPLADEIRQLSKSLEAGLSAGFADLTRVLDVIMAAQSVSAVQEHAVDAQGISSPRDPLAGDQFNDLSQEAASQLDPHAILEAFRASRRDS